jgi:large subunit ribosomal protein L22
VIEARATARYIRTSAQKAGLVMNLIRGRDVNLALATLRFARKGVARDVEKVLRSAIANAQTKEGFGGDVDRLFVASCYANQGPSAKRIRPAPMGRAFRVLKRTAHLTVMVAERPEPIGTAAKPRRGARKAETPARGEGKVAAKPHGAAAKGKARSDTEPGSAAAPKRTRKTTKAGGGESSPAVQA